MMNNKAGYYSPTEITSIFARLDPRDVEQFYRSYHLWALQQQIAGLQKQDLDLRQQIAENNELMQQVRPSAIALATLARLQSNGVNDIDLLDRMLERGETWLDQTMQRLAYCEKFDFIRDNYTEWCENALDGAYDWIDSLQEAGALSPPDEAIPTTTASTAMNDSFSETTEEILLQKLMSEEDEDSLLEPTLKRPALLPATEEAEEVIYTEFSDVTDSSDIPMVQALEIKQTDPIPAAEEVPSEEQNSSRQMVEQEYNEPIPVPEDVFPIEISDTPHISDDTAEAVSAQLEESSLVEAQDTLSPPESHPLVSDDKPRQLDVPVEVNTFSDQSANQVKKQRSRQQPQLTKSRQKRSFLQRLFTAFFGK